jgi:hypothetical protein
MPRFESNIVINATPSEPNHAARMEDLELAIAVHFKPNVRAVRLTNLPGAYAGLALTGPMSDVLPPIDGVALELDDRLLLAGQTDDTQNGIYTVTRLGDGSTESYILTRAADFDSSSDISPNVQVKVSQGVSSHDQVFTLVTDAPITLDSTSLDFEVSSGRLTAVKERVFRFEGDGTSQGLTYSHGWNTRYVTVEVIYENTWETVYADVSRPTDNTVHVEFAAPPQPGQFYAVVVRAQITPV